MTFAADGCELFKHLLDEEEISSLKGLLPTNGRAGSRNILNVPKLHEFATSPTLVGLLPEPGLGLVRGLLFDKTAESNWPVLWHQDLSIAVTERRPISGYGPWSVKNGVPHVQPPLSVLESMITLRIHLDPTPEDNGALCVIPGSHRDGVLDPGGVDCLKEETALAIACAVGDVFMMRPLLLHSSPRSKTPSHRRILHFEYAKPESLHPDLHWAATTQ